MKLCASAVGLKMAAAGIGFGSEADLHWKKSPNSTCLKVDAWQKHWERSMWDTGGEGQLFLFHGS